MTSRDQVHEMVGGIGEFALLQRLLPRFAQSPAVLVGPGDDAAVIDVGGAAVVASVDVLVDGVHFRRAWFGGEDIGYKAAAVNMADIAAMGARPVALLVGLAAPPDLSVEWFSAFADGMQECVEPIGCSVVGGDTVQSDLLTIAVTALGVLDGPAVTRSGARPGDVLAVCGRLGWAAAGLAVLQRGFRSPRLLVDAQRRPQPPYAAGPAAAAVGATAMIDVSDGLLADAGHLAQASGVQIVVDVPAVVLDPSLESIAPALGVDPRLWVLGGGEDHALLACFPSTVALPAGWYPVGRVQAGQGVLLEGAPEGFDPTRAGGWQHFRA